MLGAAARVRQWTSDLSPAGLQDTGRGRAITIRLDRLVPRFDTFLTGSGHCVDAALTYSCGFIPFFDLLPSNLLFTRSCRFG
jgi:hypothetical protein